MRTICRIQVISLLLSNEHKWFSVSCSHNTFHVKSISVWIHRTHKQNTKWYSTACRSFIWGNAVLFWIKAFPSEGKKNRRKWISHVLSISEICWLVKQTLTFITVNNRIHGSCSRQTCNKVHIFESCFSHV